MIAQHLWSWCMKLCSADWKQELWNTIWYAQFAPRRDQVGQLTSVTLKPLDHWRAEIAAQVKDEGFREAARLRSAFTVLCRGTKMKPTLKMFYIQGIQLILLPWATGATISRSPALQAAVINKGVDLSNSSGNVEALTSE